MTGRSPHRLRWEIVGRLAVVLAVALAVTLVVGDSLAGELSAEQISLAVAFVAYAVVGGVLMARVPGHLLGPVFALIGLVPLSGAAVLIVTAAAADPGQAPSWVIALVGEVFWIPGLVCALVFPALLSPTGHALSRRWSLVGWATVVVASGYAVLTALQPAFEVVDASGRSVSVVNPLGITGAPAPQEGGIAAVVVLALAFASLVLRYRRAGVEMRAQLKWVLYAMAVLVGWVMLVIAVPRLDESIWGSLVFAVLLAGIPVAAAVAILRYRLYEIDVVINKTLVYGALAVFVVLVVGLIAVIGVGGTTDLALPIVAAAVVAVAFQPVRRWVQRLANRLVYGDRATPYEVLSELSGTMAHVETTDELLPRVAAIVAEWIGAARVEMWLRLGSELVRRVEWSDGSRPPLQPPIVSGDEVSVADADAAAPVRHHGELLGVISVAKHRNEPLTTAEMQLLQDLASQAGLMLRNVRLVEELRSSRQRLVTAQDEERRRLERDLHDGAQQRLVSIALGLRLARGMVDADAGDGLAARLDQASSELALALSELRDLARGIHPAILSDRGLIPAITSLTDHSALPASVESTLDRRLPAAVEAACYFVVAEGLANAARYSQATSVRVQVGEDGGWVQLEVTDDGQGGADPLQGSGLRGLVDRVEAIGGSIEVHSPLGEGTTLRCRIPSEAAPSTSLVPLEGEPGPLARPGVR